MNELTEISGGLPPMQLSHLFYLYDVPDSEGKMPTVEKAVEIYKEYVDYIQQGLKETHIRIDDNDIFGKKDLYFKFYYLNLKINDIIYEKYGHVNDQIVKYVLRVNHMFEDIEIKNSWGLTYDLDGTTLIIKPDNNTGNIQPNGSINFGIQIASPEEINASDAVFTAENTSVSNNS